MSYGPDIQILVRQAAPLAARAQQAESTPRIGLLWPGDAPPASPRMELIE
jgi:hypothetical protein